jgi:isoquinoline 1-oxidoreductase alpha subunit
MKFLLNGKEQSIEGDGNMPLLWALRDEWNLTGTKYGCGLAQCGACTVYVDGQPQKACVVPLSAVEGKKVTTIEGLEGKVANAVQESWVKFGVPQCGYCQSGQVMSATALLTKKKNPSEKEIDEAMNGNICRCGTYLRIRAAIQDAAKNLS